MPIALAALAALAQETRLTAFRLLVAEGRHGLAAGVIADRLRVAPATLSFHLKELTRAGLVVPRQEGRFVYYAAAFDQMNDLLAFLTDNCCAGDGTDCAPAALVRRRTTRALATRATTKRTTA